MRKFGLFALAVCASIVCAGGVQAQTKTTGKAKTTKVAKAKADKKKGDKADAAKKDKKKEAKAAVADTVSVADFSYAMGMAQSEGLKQYLAARMNVDTTKMDDFMRGLKEAMEKSTDKSLGAYAAGLQIGQQVVGQFLPQINKQITDDENSHYIDDAQFKQGFATAVSGGALKMPLDSAKNIVRHQMEFYHERLMETKYGQNRADGEKFLAENAKKEGVKLVPGSKVQYKVIKEGNGPKPKATDKVEVNYEGKLIDGTVFDSSYKRNKPATFPCDGVIKGWTEALVNMPVGSVWEIYIPQELGYGLEGTRDGKIKPFSALIFKVELLSIKDDTKKAADKAKE